MARSFPILGFFAKPVYSMLGSGLAIVTFLDGGVFLEPNCAPPCSFTQLTLVDTRFRSKQHFESFALIRDSNLFQRLTVITPRAAGFHALCNSFEPRSRMSRA
jgi:hypothetical protein